MQWHNPDFLSILYVWRDKNMQYKNFCAIYTTRCLRWLKAQLAEMVPSLHVRVYLIPIADKKNKFCSLTAREGISQSTPMGSRLAVFPHCTWGYIDEAKVLQELPTVPSLHVRVYRERDETPEPPRSSLTAREGISRKRTDLSGIQRFPHCTWGYIIWHTVCEAKKGVPSLHVRVYRKNEILFRNVCRSLTIRESIQTLFCSVFFVFKYLAY